MKNQFPLLLEGINLTIFAFGQTSTGKTFTMKGKFPSNEGIIPLSIKEIFSLMDNNKNLKVKFSYFELYNENINDLLDVNKKNLEIRENSNKEIIINNLTEISCDSKTEILNLFFKGEENRKISYTKLNVNSSRSHTIFRLNIENLINNKKYFSVLNLIDLAGSENCNKTLAKGKVLKEVGQRARVDIEALLGSKVFLELWVKVQKDWRNKQSQLRDFGFREDEY